MSRLTSIVRASALVASVALLTPPVAAQRANSVEISAFYGGYWGSDIYAGQVNQSGALVTVGLNSATGYGARLGYNFKPSIGIEFTWSASDPSMRFNSAGFGSSRPSGDLSINNFDFDVNFMFGQQRVWGYFALGAGWSDFSPTVSYLGLPVAVNGKSYFAGNAALGIKFLVSPKLALRGDLRYRQSNTNHYTSAGTGCYYYCYSYASTWYGATEFNGGLTYIIGR